MLARIAEKLYPKSKEFSSQVILAWIGFNGINFFFLFFDQGADIIDDDLNLYAFVVTSSFLILTASSHFSIWYLKDNDKK